MNAIEVTIIVLAVVFVIVVSCAEIIRKAKGKPSSCSDCSGCPYSKDCKDGKTGHLDDCQCNETGLNKVAPNQNEKFEEESKDTEDSNN